MVPTVDRDVRGRVADQGESPGSGGSTGSWPGKLAFVRSLRPTRAPLTPVTPLVGGRAPAARAGRRLRTAGRPRPELSADRRPFPLPWSIRAADQTSVARPSVSGVDMEDGQEAAPDRPLDFDDTFRRCFGPMVRSLAVAAGDREVAADCVQDAFMRAYVRWSRVSRLDDPVGWIRHVAVNRMRDHFRKTERGTRALTRLPRRNNRSSPRRPREPSELAALLAQLPTQQRIAAALFYVEDLSVSEIADAMRLSEGAVKYHLHAARATLRGALEPQS